MKQNLLKNDLTFTELSNDFLKDIDKIGIKQVLDKYSEIVPRYELYGYLVNYLSSIVSANHIKDRVQDRRENDST